MVTLLITALAQYPGGLLVYGKVEGDTLERPVVLCVNDTDATDIVNLLADNVPLTLEVDKQWLVPVLSPEVKVA